MEYIFRDIEELTTPVGIFSVYCADKKIPFSVIRNNFDVPYSVYDENNNVTREINIADTYYILISTSDLETGSVIKNQTVVIGAYDPNDNEKTTQIFQYSELNDFKDLKLMNTVQKLIEEH